MGFRDLPLYVLMVLFKSVTKISTTISWKPELDQGFLERRFLMYKGVGSVLLILPHFS